MEKPQVSEELSRPPTRQEGLTPAERQDLRELCYWNESIFPVEWSSASVIAGLEIPVVGGMVGLALDHSIEATDRDDGASGSAISDGPTTPRSSSAGRMLAIVRAHVPRPRRHPVRRRSRRCRPSP